MIADRFPSTRIPITQFRILVQQFESSMRFASGTTRHVYRKALDQLVAFARSNPFKFTPSDIAQFRLWLLNKKKLTNNSVNTYLTASRRFCEFLVELGVLQKNPAWSVHGRAQDFRMTDIDLPQVERAIATIERATILGKRDFAFLTAMMESGATISELLNADIGDLKRSGKSGEMRVKSRGKRSKTEILRLSEQAHRAILDYISSRGPVAADEPLFAKVHVGRSLRTRLTSRGVRAAMRKRLRFSGRKSLPLDSVRTFCGLKLLKQGKTAEEVRVLMRFKSMMPLRRILLNSQSKATAK